MTLDMAQPAHREALRWACECAATDIEAARRFVTFTPPDSIRLPEDEPRNEALRMLLDPSLAAEGLRGLLEWIGVSRLLVDEVGNRAAWPIWITVWSGPLTSGGRGNVDAHVLLKQEAAPGLFPKLLAISEDAPDRHERALAVLRGAS